MCGEKLTKKSQVIASLKNVYHLKSFIIYTICITYSHLKCLKQINVWSLLTVN